MAKNMSNGSNRSYSDSRDKILLYLTCVIKEDSHGIAPMKKLVVSPLICRKISCVENCGACCRNFTVDWLPAETRPLDVIEREFLGKLIYSNLNESAVLCSYNKGVTEKAHCSIHDNRPMLCDFEMLRFKVFVSKSTVLLGTFPYGRCWNMLKIDGTRGGLCVTAGYDEQYKQDVIRRLNRLKQWANYVGVETYIDEIIHYVENTHSLTAAPLVLTRGQKSIYEIT